MSDRLPDISPGEAAVLVELVKLGLAAAHPSIGRESIVTVTLKSEEARFRVGQHLEDLIGRAEPGQKVRRALVVNEDATLSLHTEIVP